MILGILGGGQLGMMMLEANEDLGLDIRILEKTKDCPCGSIKGANITLGDFRAYEDVYRFGKACTHLTVEIEHVNIEALEQLEKEGVRVSPSSQVLRIVQDKGLQKEFYQKHGFPTAPFSLVADVLSEGDLSFPVVQKLRKGGYDGKGVQMLPTAEDLSKALPGSSVLEAPVDIEKEISIIVVRTRSAGPTGAQTNLYPPVEMVFDPETNLVTELFAPAHITSAQKKEAETLAQNLAEALDVVGLLAVEMFIDRSGKILINEIAPRPHNSGHHTIEANKTSQFENHLRAVGGLPLGGTKMVAPAVMVNVLGEEGHSGPTVYEGLPEVDRMPQIFPHLYGKKETRPHRKMGHITVLDPVIKKAQEKARKAKGVLRVVS